MIFMQRSMTFLLLVACCTSWMQAYNPELGEQNSKTIKVVTGSLKNRNGDNLTQGQKEALEAVRTGDQFKPSNFDELPSDIQKIIGSYLTLDKIYGFSAAWEIKDAPQAVSLFAKLICHYDNVDVFKQRLNLANPIYYKNQRRPIELKDFKIKYRKFSTMIGDNLAKYSYNVELFNCLPKTSKNGIGMRFVSTCDIRGDRSNIEKEFEYDQFQTIKSEKNLFDFALLMSLYLGLRYIEKKDIMTDFEKIKYAKFMIDFKERGLQGWDKDNPLVKDIENKIEKIK